MLTSSVHCSWSMVSTLLLSPSHPQGGKENPCMHNFASGFTLEEPKSRQIYATADIKNTSISSFKLLFYILPDASLEPIQIGFLSIPFFLSLPLLFLPSFLS